MHTTHNVFLEQVSRHRSIASKWTSILMAKGTTLATTTTRAITSSSTVRPTSTSSAPTTTTTASPGTFVRTSGTKFSVDGRTGYFPGTNSYWIGFLQNNADIDLVMSHLQQSGLKILRVWGFNDVTTDNPGTVYYQKFTGSSPTINTGADGLQRLDYVVQSAANHGIKLIINFVNNWTDYGGMDAYVKYYGLANHQAWYTSTAAQAQYQRYISAVVSRYRTSTAVMAWELANEPRCNGCATSVITNWARTTSAYIKSLDSNHLVTLGDEGFNPSTGDGSYPYSTGEGIAFAENLKISTLDFGTYHMYPTSWVRLFPSFSPRFFLQTLSHHLSSSHHLKFNLTKETQQGQSESTFPAPWIQAHSAACIAAKKPCLFEEYGSTANHIPLYPTWQNISLANAGNAGDLFWQLGDTLSSGRTSDDGNTVYYGGSEWDGVVTAHVRAVAAVNGF